MEFYEETLGAYPLDHLTVVTVPRGFSQGLLGFITFQHFVASLDARAGNARTHYSRNLRTEIIAHEKPVPQWSRP